MRRGGWDRTEKNLFSNEKPQILISAFTEARTNLGIGVVVNGFAVGSATERYTQVRRDRDRHKR